MPNQPSYRGTCFCKAVEIEAIGAPAVMAFCHCESCRTWLSAPVHGQPLWPAADVQVRKAPTSSGRTRRPRRATASSAGTAAAACWSWHPPAA